MLFDLLVYEILLLVVYILHCEISGLSVYPESVQTEALLRPDLFQLSLGRSINHNVLVLNSILDGLHTLCPSPPQQQNHHAACYNTRTHHAHHDQIALSVLVRTLCVCGPPRIQCISGQDGAEVTKTRHEGRSRSDTDFAMTRLEDGGAHGHDGGNGGAETKADDQEASISRPAVVAAGKSGREKTSKDDETRQTEDEVAVGVEAIAERCDEEDGDQVHDPDGCEKKRQVDTTEAGIDGMDDHGTVTLHSDA